MYDQDDDNEQEKTSNTPKLILILGKSGNGDKIPLKSMSYSFEFQQGSDKQSGKATISPLTIQVMSKEVTKIFAKLIKKNNDASYMLRIYEYTSLDTEGKKKAQFGTIIKLSQPMVRRATFDKSDESDQLYSPLIISFQSLKAITYFYKGRKRTKCQITFLPQQNKT